MSQEKLTFDDKTNLVPFVNRARQICAEDINELKIKFNDNIDDNFNRSNTPQIGYKLLADDFDFSNIPVGYDNSIWEIRRVYDLNAMAVEIPANVTLRAIGGKLTNYTSITGNNTRIEAGAVHIFDGSGDLDGTWKVNKVYPQWFGAKGDGVADDTNSVQYALSFNVAPCVFAKGTYVVEPLTVLSDTVIELSPNTTLLAKSGYIWSDRLLNINNVSNVVIKGNGGTIQMLKADYVTGEDRHCINISQSENIYIENLTCKDSGGDGFYIGGDTDYPSRNITIFNCIADNNRRQGMSIVNVIDCFVIGGIYKNTIGTAPQSGIDIEPNPLPGHYIQNVHLNGVKTYNNEGSGILITPYTTVTTMSVNIVNHVSEYDGKGGSGAILIANSLADEKTTGTINIDNLTIINPKASGLVIVRWNQFAPQLKINNLYVINPGSDPVAAAATTLNTHALWVYNDATVDAETDSYGHFYIDGFKVEDNRDVLVMNSPARIYNLSSYPMKNIKIHKFDVTYKQWTDSSDIPLRYDDTNNWENIDIEYVNDVILELPSSTLTKRYIGTKVAATASSGMILPVASTMEGSWIELFQKNAGYIVVTPAAGDKILGYTGVDQIGLTSRTIGSRIKLKSYNGDWMVMEITGSWGLSTFYSQKHPMSASATSPQISGAPGTWERGDIVWYREAYYGKQVGWVCTVAGSPGSWNPFGLIQNETVQELTTTTPTWDVRDGVNAKITLTGATTITMTNLFAGMKGKLVVTNGNDVLFKILFAPYAFKIKNSIRDSANKVVVSGGTTIDIFEWYYDGTNVYIDGEANYN